MKWETVKLEECCCSISDGDHQPPPKVESGIPFVTISDITETNKFDFDNTAFVSKGYYDRLDAKRKAQSGDILYSVVGSFGIPVLIKENVPFVFQRHIAILRPNTVLVDPRFLYYTMLSREFFAKADAVATGTAQRTIGLDALRHIKIALPTMSVQHRIADMLSTYDDLIENNQKQIKLLEEAAKRLYKEWFVDLHFPGYEDVPVVDGVPKGWERNRADSFFGITIGKTPPRAEQQWFVRGSDGIPWLSISDMSSTDSFALSTSEALTEDAVNKFHVKVVPPGTVFVSFKLTVGRVAIAAMDMCTNEAIAHFHIEDAIMRAYTYCYLCNFEYDTLGSTSSISKAVNSRMIKAMPFVMPSKEVLRSFSKRADSILNMIKNKQLDCIKLKEARDRLLPKLMSGELEV